MAWLPPVVRRRLGTIFLAAAAVLLAFSAILSDLSESPIKILIRPTHKAEHNIAWHVGSPKGDSIPPEWTDQGGDHNPLDPLYGKLRYFSAQFNWPKTIPYDRGTEIIFIIEGDKPGSGDDLIESFPGDPKKLEVRGADEMSARLSAPKGDAEVIPRSEKQERQLLTRLGPTKWIWDVKPERAGSVVLTLDVFAHVILKSKDKTIPDAEVPVLTKRVTIPIAVTAWDRTKFYLAEIDPVWKTVAAIAGGIAAVLAFLLGLWPRKKAGSELS